VLGAIVAFIIDKRFRQAAAFSFAGAVLTFVGLIHAEKVQWNADFQVTLGYLFLAVVCVLFALGRPAPREPEPGEPPAFEGEPAPEPVAATAAR
jgi:AGZA family xanthine/uracil permease-like MFS transporter